MVIRGSQSPKPLICNGLSLLNNSLFFDYYSAGVDVSADKIISAFRLDFPHVCLERGRARNGYLFSDLLVNPAGETVLTLLHGGVTQGTKVNCTATGIHWSLLLSGCVLRSLNMSLFGLTLRLILMRVVLGLVFPSGE